MIELLINSEKERINKSTTNYEKLNHLNNYIQLKINCEKYKTDVTIYGDIKDYLVCYYRASEEKVYGYYDVTKDKILDKINIVNLSEQINLLNFIQRIIKLDGQERD